MAEMELGNIINEKEEEVLEVDPKQNESIEKEEEENFRAEKQKRKAFDQLGAFGRGFANWFLKGASINDRGNPVYLNKLEKETKSAAREGRPINYDNLLTDRERKLRAQYDNISKDKITETFGKDISSSFRMTYSQLDIAGFNLKKIKEANLLSPEFDDEKNHEIGKDLKNELSKISMEQSQKVKNNPEFTPMTSKEQKNQAIKNVSEKLKIGEQLGLENTAQDIRNINLAMANGYTTADDIKKLIGGKGPQKMSKIKEAIANEAISKGSKMFEIDKYGQMIQVEPKTLINQDRFKDKSKAGDGLDSLIKTAAETGKNDITPQFRDSKDVGGIDI